MLRFALFALSLLPSAALAETVWQNGGAQVITASYVCSGGMDELSVAYFNAPDGTSFAAVHIAGQVHAMVQDVSGSGARYVDIDEQSGYRIHTKGEGLLLLKLAADDAAEEELLAECTAQQG